MCVCVCVCLCVCVYVLRIVSTEKILHFINTFIIIIIIIIIIMFHTVMFLKFSQR